MNELGLLQDLKPPIAPELLRQRVLTCARDAIASAPRPTVADRVWFSRGWRIAYAGVLVLLVVIELLAAQTQSGAGRPQPGRMPVAITEADTVADAIGLRGPWLIGVRLTNADQLLRLEEELL